jgi:hypothetical protein
MGSAFARCILIGRQSPANLIAGIAIRTPKISQRGVGTMRRPVMSTVTAAMTLAAAMTLSAQTPSPQTRPQTPPQTDRQRPSTDTQARTNTSMQSITVQGCVREGTSASARTSNSGARTGGNTDHYMLTNVKMAQGSTTSGLALANSYQLQGLSASELKNHVGHQVEVVGTLQNDGHMGATGAGTSGAGTTGTTGAGATGTTGQRGTTGTTAQRGGSGSMAQSGNRSDDDMQELRATSVKMISQTCTAQ